MPYTDGTQLGRYVIQRLLGKGGMGEVYLAYDPKLGRMVALKILPQHLSSDMRNAHRFAQEARAASALNHPNVAHIYEIEETSDGAFIVLEYIDGETLRARLRRSTLGLAEALEIAVQVADALASAHAAGVVHRDIKPENVMLAREGFVKVLDFGLAKLPETPRAFDDNSKSTVSLVYSEPGVLRGTVAYMSPEQARGLEVDARTDVWSLGVLLYEMLAGRTPFEGDTSSDVIAAILHQPPPPLARFSREVTEAAEWIVLKALAKDRSERYGSAREFQNDLRRLMRRLSAEADADTAPSSNSQGGRAAANDSGRLNSAGHLSAHDSASDGARSVSSAEYIVNTIQRHRKVSLAVVVSALLVFGVAAAFGAALLLRTRRAEQPPQRPLRRLTFESGLQDNPTWSPDGRYIAYSSDRSGNFDIWVQSTKGGDAIRITNSEQHDWQPDWSPDGNSIAFRSERDGGGLFVVPAPFGGQQRKLSSFGYNPRWSPDGSKVLFFGLGTRLYERPKVFVVGLDGSPPQEVSAFIEGYEQGVKRGALDWHPDGRRVSFLADDKSLWTVPIEGGGGVRSAVDDAVARRLKEAAVEIENFRWSTTGNSLFIEGRSQGVLNIWRITVDLETLRWVGGPERLTVGDGQDTDISISRDGTKIAYTKKNQSTGIWLFPFDAARGQIKGPGQPVTPRDSDAWFPDISADGRKIIFSVFRQGMVKQEIWEMSLGGQKDRRQSEQRRLAEISGAAPFCLRWSPDSTRIAFSRLNRVEPGGTWRAASMFLLNTADGAEQPLTSPPASEADAWRDYVYDWSRDGQWVIGSTDRLTPERWLLAMFPVAGAPSAEKGLRVVLKDPDADLWAPRVSPNGRWIAYLRQEDAKGGGGATSAIYIVPAEGGTPVRITDDRYWSDKPRWSPDGKSIFFVSNRDSYFLNVWGVRFDPSAGTAIGEPFRVTSIGKPSQQISNRLSYMEIALSQELLVLPLTEVTGSVWVMENVQN